MARLAVVLFALLASACAPIEPEPAPMPVPIPVAAPSAAPGAIPMGPPAVGLVGDYTVTLAETDFAATVPDAERRGTAAAWDIAFHQGNHLVVTHNGKEVLQGTYQVNGNQITFGEDTGPYACRAPGTYTWQMNNGLVTFTRVQDACQGRVLALTSRPLTRRP